MKQLLAELFEQYYKDVYTYLYHLSRDPSLSEDLASEVFLETVKSVSTFRGESDIKTWLFSIARHRWFAYLKQKNRQVQTESIYDLHDTAALGVTDAANDAAELIQELKKRATEQAGAAAAGRMGGGVNGPAMGAAGKANSVIGGPVSEDKAVAGLPVNMQTKYGTMPGSAQAALRQIGAMKQ